MKILLLGANGQVGFELARSLTSPKGGGGPRATTGSVTPLSIRQVRTSVARVIQSSVPVAGGM